MTTAPPPNELPKALAAPTFSINDWNVDDEPIGLTRLRAGESFLDGARRISERTGGESPVAKSSRSIFPGMRVADDQIGVIMDNGAIRLRPPGAYISTAINPWKMTGAVIPIRRVAGQEFDPVKEAAIKNKSIATLNLGQSFRQIVLQAQQVGVFEDQTKMYLASMGTYVYSADTSMRGVIDLNCMNPVVVERETEDTVAANKSNGVRIDHHGRAAPANQAHGTSIETTKRFILAGYTVTVAGFSVARPEKGFVVMHKDSRNRISMTEGICIASGNEDFVRHAKDDSRMGSSIDDLVIEFGDLNHYAKVRHVPKLRPTSHYSFTVHSHVRAEE